MKSFILLLTILFLGEIGQAQEKQNIIDTLYASQLKPFGRTLLNKQQELELISSAVHFGFKFEGDQCTIFASVKDQGAHNYIQYELDGVYQKRIRINGNLKEPIVIKTSGKGEHTVWIYKATEAHTGPIIISKIVASHVKAESVIKAPLIEFIGNSITCGAASDTSEVACGKGEYQDQHNAYMAYGPRVARALGVNYIMSSVSGIGIYRTWNMEGLSMPQVYENIDFQLNNPVKWNFKTYTPQIVSIALGTNDLSNGDGKSPRKPFDEKIFTDNFVNFIKLVKQKYPKARIALLSSPMISGTSREVLQKCLLTIKSKVNNLYPNDKSVETFFFPLMQAHGCTGHPSVADHLILAEQLKPFYQKLLKN
ncbi:GDSL family lipase [Pedobacter sp. CCM 8938]|uniref:GDSL family lipase n=2 Tax=Pedobacter fastidiosus TaxID=2765361 RepID=A0ABR7KY62_9SPHI|nr:SGNH/GDSL hydrolase family protein [Pedobacter fastidiosus]MBC6112613.1 GDSL family lipase [Pedobacter fastidiosus]